MSKHAETVRLGEVVKVVSGSTPSTANPDYWTGDIPWVTPADLSSHSGIYFRGTPKRITVAGLSACSAQMLPPGSILFSSRAPIGHIALTDYPLCTNQGFKNLVPSPKLDALYGFFALKFVTPRIIAMGRGATFAEVSKEIVEQIRIPFCELPEQRRIAAQLAEADRLRRMRRDALGLSDAFLPAAFIRMFGDPATNPYGWPTSTIGDQLSSSDYGTSQRSSDNGFGYVMLGMSNITFDGELDLSVVSRVELAPKEFQSLRLRPGDIIYNRTNSTELVGKTACWESERDAVLASYLVRLRLREALLPRFFVALLNSPYFKKVFQSRCKRAVGQSNFNPTLLRELPLYVPPTALQQQYVNLFTQHARLRAQQREALRQAEHLFQTLLHRAFS